MKEAAGEANMTVVTIILIAAIVAIATPIVTNAMKNVQARSECMNGGGTWTKANGGSCDYTNSYDTTKTTP